MKKVWDFLKNFVIIAYILLIIFVTICLLSYNKYKVTVFGKSTFLPIIDEDLEPDYKYGDLLIINRNNLSSVKEGDVIFFYRTVAGITTVNYAKVLRNERVSDTETTFTVEGDHVFSSSYFIGKADTATIVPKVGKVIGVLESKWGFLFLGVLPSLIAFLYTVSSVVREFQSDDEDTDGEKKSKKSKKKKQKNEEKEDVISITKEDDNSKDEESSPNEPDVAKDEKNPINESNDNSDKDKKDDSDSKDESSTTSDEKNDEIENSDIEKIENDDSKEETKVEEKEEINNNDKKEDENNNSNNNETKSAKTMTEEEKKALIQAKLNSMTEEEKKALIQAKLNSMTDEQKRALIEAKKKRMEAENNNNNK